jgi:hypothetical protein
MYWKYWLQVKCYKKTPNYGLCRLDYGLLYVVSIMDYSMSLERWYLVLGGVAVGRGFDLRRFQNNYC